MINANLSANTANDKTFSFQKEKILTFQQYKLKYVQKSIDCIKNSTTPNELHNCAQIERSGNKQLLNKIRSFDESIKKELLLKKRPIMQAQLECIKKAKSDKEMNYCRRVAKNKIERLKKELLP
jgi:hypothetical protein